MKYRLLTALVFTLSLGYFLLLTAPDNTWVNAEVDGSDYLMGAKYLTLTHPTGAPLYNMVNWVLLRLPLGGTEFWRLAVWSAVASAGTATLLFTMTRNPIAPLVFLASGLVVSQSTIVETYAVITLIMVLSFHLHTKERHALKYLVLALGLAIHHLPLLVLVPLAVSDLTNGRNVRNIALVLLALPFYLYIPLFNSEPYIWTRGEGFKDYLSYFSGQGGLIGGLAVFPIDDLSERLRCIGILLVGGFAAGLPLVLRAGWAEVHRHQYLLAVLVAVPTLYYLTTLGAAAYVFMMPTFAFGAILLCKSLGRTLTHIVTICTIVLIFLNVSLYDIGVSLDPDLSATGFRQQLEQIPNDSLIFTSNRGWERGVIWLFNRDNSTSIQSVQANWLSNKDRESRVSEVFLALSLDRLYRSELVEPETKGSAIVPWKPKSRSEVADLLYPNSARYSQ